jgi:hypothetical protein
MSGMMLDHEGPDVYQLALDFLVVANGIIEERTQSSATAVAPFNRARGSPK